MSQILFKSNRKCFSCRFYDRGNDNKGMCRESSPTPLVVPTQDIAGRVIPQIVSAFPPVGDDAWCGKWAAKMVQDIAPKPVEN